LTLTLFYTTVDDAWRPYGSGGTGSVPRREDTMVFEEPTRSSRLREPEPQRAAPDDQVIQRADGARLAAGRVLPRGEFTVVAPRRQGLDYDVEPPVTGC